MRPTGRDRAVRTARPDVWRLRYPDGPVDAESLAVGPQGVAYIVTKSPFGTSAVYRLPARPDPDRVQTLTRVGAITFRAHRSDIPLGTFGTLTATGAALSQDGSLFAVRTYADAYLWRVDRGDVAAALTQPPVRVPLPVQPQGEGVAFDGHRLLVDSEGVGSTVYAVPLPASLTGRSAPTPSSAPPSSSAPSLSPGAPDPSSLNYGSLPLTFRATGSATGHGSGTHWVGPAIAAGVVALAALVGAGATARRRRAGRRAR